MKKKLTEAAALTAAAAIMLSGCARAPEPPEFDPDSCEIKMTLPQLAAANTEEAILAGHENFYVIVNMLGDRYTELAYFRNKDVFFYEYLKPKTRAHNVDIYYNGGRWYMDYSEDASPELEYRWYAMSDDEKDAMIFPADTMDLLDPLMTEKERLFDITVDKNGQVAAFTTESRDVAEDIKKEIGASGMQYNGARYDHRYTFDPETGELMYRSDYLSLASGKIRRRYDIEVLYDANEPDFLHMVTALIDHAVSDSSTETVTLTAVYDDGQTYTTECNGNYKISLVPKAGYTAYTDAQRSAFFDGTFPYENTTVYLFRE